MATGDDDLLRQLGYEQKMGRSFSVLQVRQLFAKPINDSCTTADSYDFLRSRTSVQVSLSSLSLLVGFLNAGVAV